MVFWGQSMFLVGLKLPIGFSPSVNPHSGKHPNTRVCACVRACVNHVVSEIEFQLGKKHGRTRP